MEIKQLKGGGELNVSEPETCEEDGHDWLYLGEAGGESFFKCRRCGLPEE